ncbi:flagellar hook-basal body complex protein [Komagataeibacter kakiaceti]|uniref:flagellar hook-basal body complex protein n=1 Tax=Komagataeibacter kakiaceti TaxID=943261 RepID=UPI001F5A4643|nr:flagellar hook-basal body complex protein [Komagataeibacter kakiaceti]
MAEFDNGDTQLIGKVALSNFANVDGLNAVDGQAYTATANSGSAKTGVVGENGTGTLSVGYVESSTTDLTSDLSSLIVAQEAYSANTKVVTTADELLQTTIAMKQS